MAIEYNIQIEHGPDKKSGPWFYSLFSYTLQIQSIDSFLLLYQQFYD